ncbi:hypothetical protein [Pseudoalteromonas tunicata]|jgi:hypothetical protein|uniref:Putative orphan protein n=1 Tax=Pseudoalteromonas tunicata D2 TaxID=87626 RepID=A4C8S0_9GAMM|nr:hypothetical protein [Pseudoalteromonas tunicata]ATC93488.1 hypothetical protein PTUN_a0742 [Pseudoalteromonas tunicata]AXT32527.1 hypothetical protein D1819_17955 [Pseudoalteromonas tunicata]EAR28985.1 putative orphan protein [Pseudoalteromonas tunicata D2]
MTENLKSESCKCFDEYLAAVREKIVNNLGDNAIDTKVEWSNTTWILGGDYAPVNPQVKFEYRKIKKGGEIAKGITKDCITVSANFCCFCGRKYQKADK